MCVSSVLEVLFADSQVGLVNLGSPGRRTKLHCVKLVIIQVHS